MNIEEAEHTGVEEHVTNGRCLFVDLEWVPSQDDALGDHPGGIRVKEAAHRDQLGGYGI